LDWGIFAGAHWAIELVQMLLYMFLSKVVSHLGCTCSKNQMIAAIIHSKEKTVKRAENNKFYHPLSGQSFFCYHCQCFTRVDCDHSCNDLALDLIFQYWIHCKEIKKQ
jgi:hypothetical protein